jgi:hypothetical protein
LERRLYVKTITDVISDVGVVIFGIVYAGVSHFSCHGAVVLGLGILHTYNCKDYASSILKKLDATTSLGECRGKLCF